MKQKPIINILLCVMMLFSPILNTSVYADEIDIPAYVSENTVSDTDITTEQETLSEESIPVSADNVTVSENNEVVEEPAEKTISENSISEESAGSNNNSEWKYIDLSSLLYISGSFPSGKEFDFSDLPEINLYDKLKDKDDFSKEIYECIKSKTNLSNIGHYKLTEKQVTSRIATVINQTPEFFYANKEYWFKSNTEGFITDIQLFPDENITNTISHSTKINYTTTEEEKELENKADIILSQINPCWNAEEIALYLHNWLVLNCEYDYECYYGRHYNPHAHDAYGAIVEGLAVCQGYALAYEYLMNKANVLCAVVGSNKMNHAWNIMQINKKNYYVDVQGDDRSKYACEYLNFMVSRDVLHDRCLHLSEDWSIGGPFYSDYESTETSTDHDEYYWNNVRAPIAQNNQHAAYVINMRSDAIYIHNYATNADTKIDYDVSGMPYIGYLGEYLVIGAGKTIHLVDTSTNTAIQKYTIPDNILSSIYSRIIGISVSNGIVTYVLTEDDDTISYTGTLDWSQYLTDRSNDTLTISFESNGGSSVPAQTIKYNTKVTEPAEPTKEGVTFGEWYVDSAFTRKFDFNSPVTCDLTLYAKWYGPHTVKFVDGTNENEKILLTVSVPHKGILQRPEDPVKEGKILSRWGFVNNSNIVEGEYDFSKPVLSDLKLRALWKEGYRSDTDIINGQSIDIKTKYFPDLTNVARYRTIIRGSEKSASKYATVSAKGILTAKKTGYITVIPQYKDDQGYHDFDGKTLTATIISKPALKFTRPLSYTGQTIDIYDLFKDDWKDNGFKAIKFTSSKPDIAEISDEGIITAKDLNGFTNITAYFCIKGQDNAANTLKVSAKLNVKHPVYAKEEYTLLTGQKFTLGMKNVTASMEPVWESSDSEKLSITSQFNKNKPTGKAVLKAFNSGEYTVTAKIDDKDYVCNVKVIAPEIKKSELKVKTGKIGKVALKNTKYNANQVEWHSEDESIAVVKMGGKVKGISEGTVKIYTETGGVRNECTVEVY